jgi:hypothetical protein
MDKDDYLLVWAIFRADAETLAERTVIVRGGPARALDWSLEGNAHHAGVAYGQNGRNGSGWASHEDMEPVGYEPEYGFRTIYSVGVYSGNPLIHWHLEDLWPDGSGHGYSVFDETSPVCDGSSGTESVGRDGDDASED